MRNALYERNRLNVDVSILLRRVDSEASPVAVVDRELVDLLTAIRDTGSVQRACRKLRISTRHAQRIVKRFTDGSGIRLLRHRGSLGTELTEGGRQCIDMHAAARKRVEQVVRGCELPPLSPPSLADGRGRETP